LFFPPVEFFLCTKKGRENTTYFSKILKVAKRDVCAPKVQIDTAVKIQAIANLLFPSFLFYHNEIIIAIFFSNFLQKNGAVTCSVFIN